MGGGQSRRTIARGRHGKQHEQRRRRGCGGGRRLTPVPAQQGAFAASGVVEVGASSNAGVAQTAAVYPLVPTRSFDDPLTYLVPDGMLAEVVPGALVEIPVGTASRIGVVATVGGPVPDGVSAKPIGRVIHGIGVPPSLVRLAEWLADQYGCARTRALALVVPPKLSAHARATSVPVRRRQQAVRRVEGVQHEQLAGFSPRLRAVAEGLPTGWVSLSAVVERLGTTRDTVRKLAGAGIVELEHRFVEELEGTPLPEPDGAQPFGERGVALTSSQLSAVAMCAQADPNDPATLLMGVTGSGKTEVYLELIQRALGEGRGAIVLVPEIALTPQTARRFLQRFPGQVEVLHSNLTRAQRSLAYDRINSGEARVVVGPRSAVFAPVRGLAVIVIDEEHDGSYKQDSEPRYDARRVAYRRAQLDDAVVVYGSATPRPETWHGVRRRAMLRERVAGGLLAPVTLVDLREEGDSFPITEPVQAAIDATLRRGRKVIVLHNRRGYANALHCRSCGHRFRCDGCDVSLVVHGQRAASQQFACHHCGFRAPLPRQCPHCSAADIARVGAGTERVERDLVERFGVEVFRLDADASRARGSVGEILADFAAAGPSILAGTQMVAKGHDFPDVELAVVIDADTALAIPDFRAEERAFSLVAQLAGRAGRSAETAEHARVLVQTWDPEHAFLQFARTHDVEGFLDRELERRRMHDYPPFARLVRVLISAPDEARSERWAIACADGLRQLGAGPVLGPAPLLRLANRHRHQVVLKTGAVLSVAAAMRAFLRKSASARSRADVRIALDVDPQALV